MKKALSVVLMLAVLLLAGCAAQTEPTTVPEEIDAPNVITVTTVDELLAAIGSDREILMEPGRYNLYWARDYGCKSENESYVWEEYGDGYQLKLIGVENLTIRGSGMDTATLVTQPRYANVLVLQNCANVTLESFTAGHTDGGECAGGVVSLMGCKDVILNAMGLFGCGTIGVQTELCSDIVISACDIYECTSYGVWSDRTDDLTVKGCTLRNLGDRQYSGGSAVWFGSSSGVEVSDCEIRDNALLFLVGGDPSGEITLKNCSFTNNRVESAAFDIYTSGMVLDNCSFDQNEFRFWFSGAGVTVLDGVGKTLTEELLDIQYDAKPPREPAGEQTQVTVSTVDELLAAIAPDTEIVLKDGDYDLSTASDYGYGFSDYYFWMEEYDGPVLTIESVNNLTIRSESGDVTKCTISAVPRYANVFNFRRSSNITLTGFTAGHTLEPGECMGGVLDFEGCDAVLVENCGLFGCGILGVQARLSSDIAVKGCEIYECSYGGISMADVAGVTIENCTFRDLGGSAFSFYDCRNVTIDGKAVNGKSYSGD